MALSACNLFKNSFEFLRNSDIDINQVPNRVRGIYVLFNEEKSGHMNVVYIGMARGESSGAKGRLKSHKRNQKKQKLWTHFSVFEVWDNISKQQIEELEGLFRHIYRKDANANNLNIQRSYKPLGLIKRKSLADWVK